MTRFWLIRHAIVGEAARAFLYGRMDVDLCETSLAEQGPSYAALAARLPREARWLVTPLSRTLRTAETLLAAAGLDPTLEVEPGLIEQDLGTWQGLAHAELPEQLSEPAHAFWPLGATETPPGGESMDYVLQRVAETLERLAAETGSRDIVAVSHGGAIRAAIAHAAGIGASAALHFSVQNLSLTRLERSAVGWRVVSVNETFP